MTKTRNGQKTYSTDPEINDSLTAMQVAKWELDAKAREIRTLVAAARAQGATWQQIGWVLNMTRQAAQQKYGA